MRNAISKKVILTGIIVITIMNLASVSVSAKWCKNSNDSWNYIEENNNQNSEITADEARNLIFKEDGQHVYAVMNNNSVVSGTAKLIFDTNISMDIINKIKEQWEMPTSEELYSFDIVDDYCELEHYYVGRYSKNVYRTGNQGGLTVYLMVDNNVVKEYPWIGLK
ncbi:hypothetical protein [Clostridium uliginosum]|uniref:Uncharacterized protein n=1 Tax=Clostridium uliginosum TaxID=119641 RepID=A0A1I1NPS5_9CLOT|nr:hypothetical protein [Clostridium uliginosum]SFC95740.1 hypothetical protein SAMN05421842_1153 [Clostridium uliginosum]